MNGTNKYLVICCIIFSAIALLSATGMAQFTGGGDIWDMPAFESQPMQLPIWSNPLEGDGDILIDNFEYHDSPLNHGWIQEEPPYPVYGFGIGYALTLETVLDFAEGSRVMEAYRPASVFILGTEYERYYVTKNLVTPPSPSSPQGSQGISCTENGVISYKWRAPLGIEDWDIFRLEIIGSADNIPFMIQVRPYHVWNGELGAANNTRKIGGYKATLIESPAYNNSSVILIQVDVGRNYNDGSWHILWLDLNDIQTAAYADAGLPIGGEQIQTAYSVRASGQQFRLDDITFRETDYSPLNQPDLFETGPLFAQLFVPYRYLFIADYEADAPIKLISDFMLDPGNFLTDQDQVREAWIADLTALDSTHPVATDPSYADRWVPGHADYGTPDPVAEQYLGSGFFIDVTLPVFSDSELRLAGSRVNEIRNHGVLGWNATIGGYGAAGIATSNKTGSASMVEPLPINPYDGMPTYIPAYYSSIKALHALGAAHYGPMLCFALESSLWNSGMKLWPNIAFMDYLPQTVENLIVTLEVTDGRRSDHRTFPMSVVNYPGINYIPIVQLNAPPTIFYCGQSNEYMIKFIDPDCFMFDLSQIQLGTPAIDHRPGWPINDISQIRTDQDELIFQMTLDGYPNYQYGPYTESLIDQDNGMIKFTPQFEGTYRAHITCRDPFGDIGTWDFSLYCVNPGTWLNHPPIITSRPNIPLVAKQGEELIVSTPDFIVTDVDGEEMYASCNIGAVGQLADGGFLWTFQTNFPGIYNVEVAFYDDSGGYAVMKLFVDIVPWWTY
ncbi:MAG: hypothetical protein ACMUJM_26140 [bacterium]